jgi:hypothetical protein
MTVTEYPAAKAHDLPMMEMGRCIGNALETALVHRELKYAEGIARSATIGMWYRHAWLVNAAGEAIDVTWTTPAERYLGRTYHTAAVLHKAQTREFYSFMDPDEHPFVPDGEIGIECYTARQWEWIRQQFERRETA